MTHPAYPDEVLAVRRKRAERGWPPVYELSVEEARDYDHRGLLEDTGPREPVARVEELEYEAATGPLPARLYAPEGEALGLLVYYHGGGWVLGELDSVDAACRVLANAAGVAVLSCEYRKAPEHPFPAAAADAEAAVRWAAANAVRLGAEPAGGEPAGAESIDTSRIAVGGDSAGGNLAAVVAQRLRDDPPTPELALQLLVYPVIEHGAVGASVREVTDPAFLTKRSMDWYWGHYLGDRPEAGRDPRASPIRAERLDGLAPALVIIAEHDPLLDEGEEYARRLADAGVPVELSRYDGMPHGFFSMRAELAGARAAIAKSAAALRAALQARR